MQWFDHSIANNVMHITGSPCKIHLAWAWLDPIRITISIEKWTVANLVSEHNASRLHSGSLTNYQYTGAMGNIGVRAMSWKRIPSWSHCIYDRSEWVLTCGFRLRIHAHDIIITLRSLTHPASMNCLQCTLSNSDIALITLELLPIHV